MNSYNYEAVLQLFNSKGELCSISIPFDVEIDSDTGKFDRVEYTIDRGPVLVNYQGNTTPASDEDLKEWDFEIKQAVRKEARRAIES